MPARIAVAEGSAAAAPLVPPFLPPFRAAGSRCAKSLTGHGNFDLLYGREKEETERGKKTEMAGGGGKEEASARWEHGIGGDETKSLNAHSFRPRETFFLLCTQ